MLGRRRERARLEEILDRIREGGTSLVVVGEAGIGKTTLLDSAARAATARGITVITTTGVPSETHLPYAGLHRLLQPFVPRIQALPGPQRDALSAAFGLTEGAAPDLFLIALAALELLAETASSSPLLLIVEDAHWLDADTCEVLAFVARRVELEPIVLLVAIRDGHDSRFEVAGLPTIQLDGLDEVSSMGLLDTHAPSLPYDVRTRVIEAAAGNPLALVELPQAVSQGVDASVVLAPVPLTERLERAFSERLVAAPGIASDLLLMAALDEGGGLDEQIEAATAIVGRQVTAADLAPAEAAGLVVVDTAGVRFRHPLVRAAVYATAPAVRRQAAHAALALAHADDVERSVWHRAASRSGSDEEIAIELEAAAARAMRRGAPAVAAAALERAAELSSVSSHRGSLLVRAAEMEFELGRATRARELLAEAIPLELDADVRSRLTFLFEASDEVSWAGAARVAAFAEIANQRTRAADPEQALKALQAAALRCWWGNPAQETRDLVVQAAGRIPVAPDDASLLAVLSFADPVRNGAVVIEQISRLKPEATGDPTTAHLLGTAATAVFAFDLSLDFLNTAVDGLRGQGRLGLLAQALVSQAWAVVHLARPSLAAAAAEEAERLARETDQLRWSLGGTARARNGCGRARRCRRGARSSPARQSEFCSQWGRSRCSPSSSSPAAGRPSPTRHTPKASSTCVGSWIPSDVAYHPFVGAWALADLIEAAGTIGPSGGGRAQPCAARLAGRDDDVLLPPRPHSTTRDRSSTTTGQRSSTTGRLPASCATGPASGAACSSTTAAGSGASAG